MLRPAVRVFNLLPLRGLASKAKKKKAQQKKTSSEPVYRLVPHIPTELTKETREFFNNQPRFKALLELVFSPLEPRETEQERLEFEKAHAEFEAARSQYFQVYEAREKRAEERMWRAIQQLPEDLHEEAIASKPEKIPHELLWHVRHRKEIFVDLDDKEKRYLQCFHNLMHVRYPHSEEKQRNPHRFLIPENQVISRQKEAALATRKVKMKKM
eukprot:gnl/TRDRNA2_/TRDRNA2_180315_c0_seq1.p1 gnl/TRDRNA2_/TRDRNA2_180315_c0~~gnl/TRDRNA2_/TRDRNA2_180315_c0_seq1.p1  ORF type:complete len:213 (-),score=58.93 gnl/TRDRNA2_/TRDRNA2_180315_c0_seq1:83-721(-)